MKSIKLRRFIIIVLWNCYKKLFLLVLVILVIFKMVFRIVLIMGEKKGVILMLYFLGKGSKCLFFFEIRKKYVKGIW